ncbi:hypothetical protein IGI04_026288 [Brassica rapa subsp. trilocularis]|uniref:Uncharacterized protein n=1 Tax=Brassica rapa subsp. trilocularis TaxID=1813537 RepID=A0ABQ7KY69_BRACM|nr:hypothetical protein IGI04_026288 [Brassica rapa subsp. trilocularis]
MAGVGLFRCNLFISFPLRSRIRKEGEFVFVWTSEDVGTEEEALLKNVERMESDIVAGCFCNAAQVIGMKCLVTAVEVREAAMHLGRTEKILEIVDRRCMPALSRHEVAKIDEWTETALFQLHVCGKAVESVSSLLNA